MWNKTPQKERLHRSSGSDLQNWLDPGPNGENLYPGDFLTYNLIRTTATLQRRLIKPYLRPFELGIPEWRLLSVVADRSPVSLSTVVEISGMDKAQISRAVAGLAGKHLVTRSSITQGGKKQKLKITPKGNALYKEILAVARRHQKRLLDSLSRQEKTHLFNAMNKIDRFCRNGDDSII